MVLVFLSLFHRNTECFPRDITQQSSDLSELHWVVDIKFFAASGKKITLFSLISCYLPSPSLSRNFTVPMPSAVELLDTSQTPIELSGSIMVTKRSLSKQM